MMAQAMANHGECLVVEFARLGAEVAAAPCFGAPQKSTGAAGPDAQEPHRGPSFSRRPGGPFWRPLPEVRGNLQLSRHQAAVVGYLAADSANRQENSANVLADPRVSMKLSI